MLPIVILFLALQRRSIEGMAGRPAASHGKAPPTGRSHLSL
ncbi:hypothetical protein [Inquilinus limosus]|nr:hypothetical protein [Inquilinus limosus]